MSSIHGAKRGLDAWRRVASIALLAVGGLYSPACAATPAGLLAATANATRFSLMSPTAFGADHVDARRLVAHLAERSTAYISVKGDAGFVGWYDPFVDGWLLTQWSGGAGSWRLAGLAAVPAEALSGQAAQGRLGWPRGDVRADLLRGHHARLAAFERAARSGALGKLVADPSPGGGAVLAAREAFVEQGLAAVGAAPGYGAYRAEVKQLFATRTDKTIADAKLRQRIDALPAGVRVTLHPVMAFRAGRGVVVAVQSPFAPALIFLADFEPRPGGAATPVHVSAVSLFAGARS